MGSKLRHTIGKLSKSKQIEAIVIDVVGDRISVRLSTNGKVLYGIPFSGGPVSPGKKVFVDYASGQPKAHCPGEATDIPVQSKPSSRPVRTDFPQSEIGGPDGTGYLPGDNSESGKSGYPLFFVPNTVPSTHSLLVPTYNGQEKVSFTAATIHNVVLEDFIADYNLVERIEAGTISVHADIEIANGDPGLRIPTYTYVYVTLLKLKDGGAETIIGTINNFSVGANYRRKRSGEIVVASPVLIDPDERLVVRFQADFDDPPGATYSYCDIYIYYMGDTQSGINLPLGPVGSLLLHASSHAAGGSDPVKLDDLVTPDDNTDLNATINYHGLLPKLSGNSSEALLGNGTWGNVAGGLSNKIRLYDSGGAVVSEYNLDAAGLDAASAAATSGDTILIPSITIDSDHALAAGIKYVGLSRFGTILTGKITGADGATLENLTIARTANDVNTLIGFEIGLTGQTKIYSCHITTTQSGTGASHAVSTAGGGIELWDCYTNGQSVGGQGYGTHNAGGLIVIDGGVRLGSTAPGADI